MNLARWGLALGLVGVSWSSKASAQAPQGAPATPQPPAQTAPPLAQERGAPAPNSAARPKPPEAPRNVTVEPSNAASEDFATRAANAEMSGNPQASLALAARAIEADPRDPWPHYDKAMALARLGNVDDAMKSFAAAEERFNVADIWGRSIAIYGGAHALATAGRCEEAKREYLRYAAFINERDPHSADMAVRYAATCRAPAPAAPASPTRPSP
jgi:tetratricopeptide (TPR) repeat protein